MSKVLVKFSNVGRNKKTWTANIPCEGGTLDANAMIGSIRRSRALLSSSIDVDESGNVTVGGFRVVGRWDVVGDAVEAT
jgi:hypothetical protein